MLVQTWLFDQMYTLENQREIEWEQDQQKKMEMIEEKTHIGKGPPPQNGLELKVYRLVGFLQSQLNQMEVFHCQAQSIFKVVYYVILETQ